MLAYMNKGSVPVYHWTEGVSFDDNAKAQVDNISRMPFMFHHVAVMPDVHWGMGATVGSVIATKGAVIPAAVGVDLGCGMQAVRTDLDANDLPDNLGPLRAAIEQAVPHGRTNNGRDGDRGAWGDGTTRLPYFINLGLANLIEYFPDMSSVERGFKQANAQMGTLGTGNHFIEVCLDENQQVWVVLHSGSRGIGNRIGTYFIEKAKEQAAKYFYEEHLPDPDLAYLVEGTPIFKGYIDAVTWAQKYARANRDNMMDAVLVAMSSQMGRYVDDIEAIDCHHNYISVEEHYGDKGIIVTRKGAVNASLGQFGIIPGSMGAKSHIVRGLGNPNSFESCSHGAGRILGRREAKREITLEDFQKEMAGINADLSPDKIDEAPQVYKSIDAVMAAQKDLVEIAHTLKQVLVVKG